MDKKKFPKNFIFGTAVASYQVEGGIYNNDWTIWENNKNSKCEEPCGEACRHYELVNEDINLLKLKKAIYISDIEYEQEMLKLLNPIINSDSVWKNQSLKFLGDFYYSISQLEKARQYYSTLLKEEINNISRAEINRRIKYIK